MLLSDFRAGTIEFMELKSAQVRQPGLEVEAGPSGGPSTSISAQQQETVSQMLTYLKALQVILRADQYEELEAKVVEARGPAKSDVEALERAVDFLSELLDNPETEDILDKIVERSQEQTAIADEENRQLLHQMCVRLDDWDHWRQRGTTTERQKLLRDVNSLLSRPPHRPVENKERDEYIFNLRKDKRHLSDSEIASECESTTKEKTTAKQVNIIYARVLAALLEAWIMLIRKDFYIEERLKPVLKKVDPERRKLVLEEIRKQGKQERSTMADVVGFLIEQLSHLASGNEAADAAVEALPMNAVVVADAPETPQEIRSLFKLAIGRGQFQFQPSTNISILCTGPFQDFPDQAYAQVSGEGSTIRLSVIYTSARLRGEEPQFNVKWQSMFQVTLPPDLPVGQYQVEATWQAVESISGNKPLSAPPIHESMTFVIGS